MTDIFKTSYTNPNLRRNATNSRLKRIHGEIDQEFQKDKIAERKRLQKLFSDVDMSEAIELFKKVNHD